MKNASSPLLSSTKNKTPKLHIFPLIILTCLLTIIPFYFQTNFIPSFTISSNTLHQAPWRNHSYEVDNLPMPRDENSMHNPNPDPDGLERPEIIPRPAQTSPVTGGLTNVKKPHIGPRPIQNRKCDLFTGEWIPNPEGPYYTNLTCGAIQDHQNCMKYGKPDLGFLKWRWKPDDCDLPIFDPTQFFELVKGKHMAFVGDSVARNHMQSLICLLSRVEYPVELSGPEEQNKFYMYKEHNFNLSMSWSPYLVKQQNTDPDDSKSAFRLNLDEANPIWTSRIEGADFVVLSAGQWFLRPSYFYLNNSLVGCLYCPESNITHMSYYFSYRLAFQTAFRAIKDAPNYNGLTFLRTYVPSHFEGGEWDKAGDCARTRPLNRNETVVSEEYPMKFRAMQLEELKNANEAGGRNSGKFRVLDAMNAMMLRPDGHPSKYGHPLNANVVLYNDCVHWCLPGPIDLWSDFLQELMLREIHS